MARKVLVIDDDPGLLTLLRLGLEREDFEVSLAGDGHEGLRVAYETHPDVIILDIMMPELDGWNTLQRLRQVCETPIIVLSGKASQVDIVKGLSLGADDYITKPCSFSELKARIQAVLRRTSRSGSGQWRTVYDDGKLCIDLTEGAVTLGGEPVKLTPTESRLLMALVGQNGRVVPHKELLVSIWGPQYANEVGYLSVYIRYLRQKLEDDPSNPEYICTHWGKGYYFGGSGTLETVE
ncbi:MAG: response regulator transcription factor [Anaerolineae bacterium]|nr:response regulator transcription factor [Anaerolineae bacterium]